MTPKFELGRDFCTMHVPPQVSSSYVNSFGSYSVVSTNKQTPLKTSNALRYTMMLANEKKRNNKKSDELRKRDSTKAVRLVKAPTVHGGEAEL